MMHTQNSGMLSLLYKPLVVVSLLLSLFGLVWLRSSVVTMNYDIRALEEKKMSALKDMKILLAQRARVMSLERIDTSFQGPAAGEKYAGGGYVFPDRVRVVHIKRNKGPVPYRASFDVKSGD